MRLRDLIALALSALAQQKLRTALTTLGIVFGTVILLSIPYLALIALMIVALAAVAALAWAIASVTQVLSRAISRRWHSRTGMTPRTTAALHVHQHPPAIFLDEGASPWKWARSPTPITPVVAHERRQLDL